MTAVRLAAMLACLLLVTGCDVNRNDNGNMSAASGTGATPQPAPSPAPPPAATGAMTVQINGLAANVDANVTVVGNGMAQFLKASATLPNLVPGTYNVLAERVLNGQSLMAPALATQAVQVVAGQTAAATVAYNIQAPFAVTVTEFIGAGLNVPMFLASPPNDARIFIAERGGLIRIFQGGQLLAAPFLDLSARTSFSSSDERGLLSFAFHPQFAQNGWVFVHFTDRNGNGDINVERFTVPAATPNVANPQGTPVIKIPHQDATNHYGGVIAFGNDGMLYISTGDGGGGGDQFRNAQNPTRLLGKMLRLNVDTLPYSIPANNPFASEVWAIGLRNPFRWSFDRTTSRMYIADVGQNRFEEVNVVAESAAGINYGWPITEGNACYPSGDACSKTGLTLPVIDVSHQDPPFPCAITGGHVYRGSAIPELRGRYFYSDYCGGFLRSFHYVSGQAIEKIEWSIPDIGRVISFGEDAAGEIYVITASGRIYRVVKQ
jgi:glucose/arabinose dehydrogenase